jgi:hypothetical protein
VIGGTTVLDTGAAAANSANVNSATRAVWRATIEGVQQNAANAQTWTLDYWKENVNGLGAASNLFEGFFATGQGQYQNIGFSGTTTTYSDIARGANTTAIDMSTSKTFVFNVINAVNNASYETRLLAATVEIL